MSDVSCDIAYADSADGLEGFVGIVVEAEGVNGTFFVG